MVRRAGTGKGYAVVGVAIAALLVASLLVYEVYFAGGGVGPSSSTTSTQSLGQKQVASRVGVYVNDLANLDLKNLTSVYSSTAVLTWSGKGIDSSSTGTPFNLKGTYRGNNISLLYTGLIAQLQPPHPIPSSVYYVSSATKSSFSTLPVSTNVVNATFRLFLSDYTAGFGFANATIYVQQRWTNQTTGGGSSAWYIDRDSWNFTSTTIQFPNH